MIAWLAFALLELNASFLLGLIVGGLSVVPSMGIILGGLPAMLIAAAFVGVDGLAWVIALLVGLQLIDDHLVQPRIDTRTLRVGPAAPLIVGLLGWELYGLGGAIYAVALLVLVLALARAVSTDDHGTDVLVANPAARSDDRAGRAAHEPGETA
jgi:predicted PurR-regulated permease PerM